MGSAKLVEVDSVMCMSPTESARSGGLSDFCWGLSMLRMHQFLINVSYPLQLECLALSGSRIACPWCRGHGRGPDGSWEVGEFSGVPCEQTGPCWDIPYRISLGSHVHGIFLVSLPGFPLLVAKFLEFGEGARFLQSQTEMTLGDVQARRFFPCNRWPRKPWYGWWHRGQEQGPQIL